jgi:hypothetical protein
VTARLGTYLSNVQQGLKLKQELGNNSSENGNVCPVRQLLEAGELRRDEFEENIIQENFDEDDIAEDPYEEFDEYYDSEAEEELIEEYERRMAA